MSKKNKIIILVVILLVFLFIIFKGIIIWYNKRQHIKTLSPFPLSGTFEKEKEIAIQNAKIMFERQKNQIKDISRGPCLGEITGSNGAEIDMPDWVVDIAHSPRQAIDNKPENQCEAYREGKAQHFVELDENGNLIKAQ